MHIYYQRSEFLKKLFPSIDINNDDQLIHALREYYKHGQHVPEVKITDDTIQVVIPNELLDEDPREFQKATNFCAQGNFSAARPILEDLIERHPNVSEYYRNLAQSYEEEGTWRCP